MNSDELDLKAFGYSQQLKRDLGSFSSFAAGFSYISIFTGMFQMFYLGFGAGGPGFFWSWPMVLIGQFFVALGFAELSAHYPLSGGVYQWAKQVGSPFLGWMTGWIYFLCLMVTLVAVTLALQGTLPQISSKFQFIGLANDPHAANINAAILGGVLILLSTFISSYGIKLLAMINNIGVFIEIVGIILLIGLLASQSVRSPMEAIAWTHFGDSNRWDLFLTAAALTASYVLYGFDTAGSLAEETQSPRKHTPWAILKALSAAGVAGLFLLLFALMATPSLAAPELSQQSGGLPWIVTTVLGSRVGNVFLWCAVYSIFVCTLAVHSGIVRIIFSMARDRLFPAGEQLAQVSSKSQTPVVATLFTGLIGLIILVVNIHFSKALELVSSIAILWANLAYAIVTFCLLYRRFEGWPSSSKAHGEYFSLGRWGIPVNIIAALWSVFMVLNVAWPRAEVYGEEGIQRFLPMVITGALLVLGTLIYLADQASSSLDSEGNRRSLRSTNSGH